ncbi:ATP-binding cassette domain-containing protein [Desulfocastanea catecholica]
MRIHTFRHQNLQIDELLTRPGETWCFFGDNSSGIDSFIDLLSGKLKDFSAEILHLPEHPAVLSFQAQQEIYEEELRNDDSDFLDKIDPGTLVYQFLPDYHNHLPLLQAFGMDHCLQLGFRQLSSGQCRKLLFLQKLIGGATTLVIQNPYDGLDQESCHELNLALQQLTGRDIELLLLVNSESDIPLWCSHLALLGSGRLETSGLRENVQPLLHRLQKPRRPGPAPISVHHLQPTPTADDHSDELIYLRGGFAGYGDKKLFTGLDLTINTGDHTLITGPNGCGKSTLLDIITGDNPKCYANTLRIFGKQRGSGESIWDIKKHMGIISPALHREHRIPGSALQVVLSGLYDSIGLYTKVSRTQINTAKYWLNWLSLAEKSDTPFRKMTYAEQRLVLIGRALIKRPRLLILDEPTQGLDDVHRNSLLDLLEQIAEKKLSTILFVSHRKDEHRPLFRRQIQLDSYAV